MFSRECFVALNRVHVYLYLVKEKPAIAFKTSPLEPDQIDEDRLKVRLADSIRI